MDNMTWQQMLQRLMQASAPAAPAVQNVDNSYPGFTWPAALPAPSAAADLPTYYADWRDFLESRRQYQTTLNEQQRQFQQQSTESQRQFNVDMLANLMRDQENTRRYEQDFGAAAQQRAWEQAYIPKRDAYSMAGAALLPNIRFLTR